MEYTMFAAALVCAVLPFTAGLECYTCTDLKIETDNDQVNALLSGQIPRDMACGDDDISGIKLETCPDGGPGQIAKCTKSKGEATASAFGQSITVTTTARSCTSVAAETAQTKDMCQTNTDESALKNVPGMQGVDVDDFEATTCICGADNCNGQTTISPAIATCLLSLALAIYALW